MFNLNKIEKDLENLFRNFIFLVILQGVNYIIPLITFPYLVKVLGVEKFGLISFAQSLVQYFIVLTDYGFNLSATQEVSTYRYNKRKLAEIFSSVLIIKAILALISLFLLTLLVFYFEKFRQYWVVFYIAFGIVLGSVLFPLWLFQGLESMKYITLLNLGVKFVSLIAILLLVHTPDDYIKVLLIMSLSQILIGLISLYIVHKYFKINFYIPSSLRIFYYFRKNFPFFLSRISVSIYTSTNTFILGLFTDNKTVGYFSIAEKLYMALLQLYSPVVNSIYPYMAYKKNISLYKKIFFSILFFNVCFILIIFLFSDEIFKLIFHQVYNETLKTFKILLIAIIFVVPSILLGYPFLAALGFSNYANLSVILGSIIHIIGLITLGFLGVINNYTVAFLVVVTEGFVLSFRLYGVLRNKLWKLK